MKTTAWSVVLVLAVSSGSADAATFRSFRQFFGDALIDQGFSVTGVSFDGKVLSAGNGTTNEAGFRVSEAGFWSGSTGYVSIGLQPLDFSNVAMDVSANGRMFAGYREGSVGIDAFRWDSSHQFLNSGLVPNFRFARAYAISADGFTFVGEGYNNGIPNHRSTAIRWTAAGGIQDLGYLPGGHLFGDASDAFAEDVSADGSVVIGRSASLYDNRFAAQAFRWTAAGGMQGLGFWPIVGPNDQPYSEANAVSWDGQVVVGYASTRSFGGRAFRWTPQTGMESLGVLPGDFSSGALAISADGSIIVGGSDATAFIWDATHGMRDLAQLLATDYGLSELSGWQGHSATMISGDGNVLIGEGYNPQGQFDRWIVHFNVVPEPSSLALGVLAAAALALFARRKLRRAGALQ